MNVVCTHSLGSSCPYCGATEPKVGAPCAVIARDGHHQLLFVGGARRTIGADRTLVDRIAAQHGVAVDWTQPRTHADGRTSWPLGVAS